MGLGSFLSKALEPLLQAKVDSEEITTQAYLQSIESGKWKGQMVYGVSESKRGFVTADPISQPGAFYVGGMGSGKSYGCRFTMTTHFCSSSEDTLYILCDPLKGMTDYKHLFPYKENVVTALDEVSKFTAVISMVYDEAMARKEAFTAVGAANIKQFNKLAHGKYPNGIAQIIIVVEEFHKIPDSAEVKYSMNVDRPGSCAAQLKDLMRIGRSYGISFVLASQRATADDVPSSLKPGLTMLMAFRVNNAGDAAGIGLDKAADIKMDQRGRCIYEDGQMQYPYFSDGDAAKLAKRFYKPMKAGLLKYRVSDYHTALSGEGAEGLVWVDPMTRIVKNPDQYNRVEFVRRVLSCFNFVSERQSNASMSLDLTATRDGKKYGVIVSTGGRRSRGDNDEDKGSEKYLVAAKEGLGILGCDHLIFFSYDQINSRDLDGVLSEVGGYAIDLEDMKRISDVIDNKDKTPKDAYTKLFEGLVLNRPPSGDLNSE